MTFMLFFTNQIFSQDCVGIGFTAAVENNQINLVIEPACNPNATYTWTWTGALNGTTTGCNPSIGAVPNNGIIQIQVEVNDGQNLCFVYRNIEVLPQACADAGFTSLQVANPCSFKFTPTNLAGCDHQWVFGDGTESDETCPTHIYNTNGTFPVRHYLVSCVGQENLITITICDQPTIINCTATPPNPNFTVVEELRCCELHLVAKPASMAGNHTWTLNIGGNCVQTQTTPMADFIITDAILGVGAGWTITHAVSGTSETKTGIFQNIGTFIGKTGQTRDATTAVACNTSNQLLLPGSTNAQTEFFIAGLLRINKNYTFSAANLCMNENSGIDIISPTTSIRTLTINNSTLSNRKNCMIWRGIQVPQRTRLITNIATFQDALFAIQPMTPIIGTTVVSNLQLTDTKFINDFVGIHANKRRFSMPVFNKNSFISEFLSNPNTALKNMPGSGLVPSAFNASQTPILYNNVISFAGIYGNAINISMPTPSIDNDFNRLANGIYVDNCNLTNVRRCRFLNIQPVFYSQSGNGIISNNVGVSTRLEQDGINTVMPNFSNVNIGVRVTNFPNVTTGVQSRNNTMAQMKIGYQLTIDGRIHTIPQGNFQSFINQNDITCSFAGLDFTTKGTVASRFNVFGNRVTLNAGSDGFGMGFLATLNTINHEIVVDDPNSFNPIDIRVNSGQAGVLINTIGGIDVLNQTIRMPLDPSFAGRGIGLLNASNTNLVSNTITGAGPAGDGVAGIRVIASGDNQIFDNRTNNTAIGLQFEGNSNSNVECNSLNAHQIGLLYKSGSMTSQQIDKGNKWLSPMNVSAQHDALSGFEVSQSRFTVPPNTPPTILNPQSAGPVMLQSGIPLALFFLETGLASVSCPQFFALNPPVRDMDLQIANGNLGFGINNAELTEDARRYLMAKLKNYPSLATGNATMQSFLNNNASNTLGRLGNTQANRKAMFELSVAEQATIDNSLTTISQKLADILAIEAQINGNTTDAQSETLLTQRSTKDDEIATQMTNINNVYAAQLQTRTNLASNELIYNQATNAVTTAEQNERTLNGIFLSTVAIGTKPNMAQKNTIRSIANQCPVLGGASVYQARAWHYNIWRERIESNNTCPGNRNNDEKTPVLDVSQSISLFPNPTSGQIQLGINDGKFVAGSVFSVVNIQGVLIKSFKIEEEMEYVDFDTDLMPNGLYFVTIQMPGYSTTTRRFVKIAE